MTQKWNLQDIKPATDRKSAASKKTVAMQAKPQKRTSSAPVRQTPKAQQSPKTTRKNNKRSWQQAFLIVFLIGAGAFFLSILMGSTELVVHPRFREPNLNATFTAVKNAEAGQLSYEVMTLEAEGERQVQATGEEIVEEQAQGSIVIYNNHQKSPVRLVTNTRFESPNGLIFRIKDSAVVPGYTTDEEGNKVPGTITAEVFADEVGEEYNIEPATFTIPGFSGSPEFDNIYAESVTKFTGGFNGPRYIVEETELETAKQALHTELRNSLLERVASEKPAGFLVFDSAVTFTYESLPTMAYGDDMATIKEKAYLRVPLFAEADFASYLATATIPGYEGEAVTITDPSEIQFSYSSATTSASNISLATELSFKLSGRPQIVWDYDKDSLRNDLLKKNRTALSSVLSAYPAIDRAEATIRPFWKQTFPKKAEDIEIVEIIE